jgi:hypothetical protein
MPVTLDMEESHAPFKHKGAAGVAASGNFKKILVIARNAAMH